MIDHRNGIPTYRPNLYATAAIVDPHPHYAAMRRLGPLVWLPRHRTYALPRYAECKATLRDDGTFTSTGGVALNPVSNALSRGTTLASDGAEHASRRALVAHRLLPRALRSVGETVDEQAAAIVDAAIRRNAVAGIVDGVADLATALPLAVVPDLVGWPSAGRDRLIDWGGATFDILGPLNRHAVRATPRAMQMLRFARRVVRERDVIEGSMAYELLAAADAGTLSHRELPALMVDYIAPSLDTTIGAISNALHLFARHPLQWQMLVDDPGLIPNAINEVVRYESPLRAFARRIHRGTSIAGTSLPAGARVLVLYASANRDEREWDDPDTFDVTRSAGRHLGFGNGAHACAGQGLARMETAAMLRALLARVERIEPAGPPTWAVNNVIHRHATLPLRLVAS